MYNIFRDHLGTITHLKTGSTISEYSFDAWGRRRDKDDWTYTLTSEPALFADRGFTAHEYLEDFKLYNMNGRLYDPVVGRFLSPDPFVQAPDFSQNFNRYSYCLNNPLKYTDPSGYKWDWRWLNPFYNFQNLMQLINDKTPRLRQKMSELNIPDFNVTASVNGAGNVNFKGDIMGQEVFNTENIDRSNAVSKTYQAIADARQSSNETKYKFGSFKDFVDRNNIGNGLFGTGIEIGSVGIGLNIELAYPEWIPGLSRNEGFSASFGFVADSKDNLDFYFTDRIPTRNNVTFSLAPEVFYVEGTRGRTVYNADIEGFSNQFGFGFGPYGGSVSSDRDINYRQWTLTGLNYGIDFSYGSWYSYTKLYKIY